MAPVAIVLRLLLLVVVATRGDEVLFSNEKFNVVSGVNGLSWSVNNKHGEVGLKGFLSLGRDMPTQRCNSDATFCRQNSEQLLRLTLDSSCLHFETNAMDPADELRDCFDLEDMNWFGGAEQTTQNWPMEKYTFSDYSYVTKEQDHMAVAERYWLNSKGIYIYVDSEVPLFIDQKSYRNNSLCFFAKNRAPYVASRPTLSLKYSVCGLGQGDAKGAHYDAIQRFLNKPSDIPDVRMIRHPIWSTWARYGRQISQDLVLEFANEILANGFNNSHLDIDDKWETCYGSLTIDTKASKFPNMKNLTTTLKDLGFRVTLWVHPFVNTNCEPDFSFATNNNYLAKDANGFTATTWWNGQGGYIDFTNPEAVEWWSSKLHLLLDNDGIDSFKFDAGETSWAPQVPVLNATIEEQPGVLASKFVETCAKFGKQIEVRVGYLSQTYPVFVRMIDLDSRWGYNNGLKSLVTTALQMNMVGYPFVLPDMIGGNGYFWDGRPNKELFLRWLQANTFMPTLQFSFVPWDYDQETIEISKKFVALHELYTDQIVALARKAVEDGSPINPPIWWIDPTDPIALATDNEFLLGESVLVAPILDQGATSRDIYLPKGLWLDNNTQEVFTGPIWIRGYSAPLDTLPYFTQQSADTLNVTQV